MTAVERCWVISDGAAGNERQALALARALRVDARVLVISVRQPWAAFAPRLTLAAHAALRTDGASAITAPWPRLAIGCGRRAALLTRLLRNWSDGTTRTIQVLDPRIRASHFDVVVTPQHDARAGANVIRTIGALNSVDDEWLAKGRADFPDLGGLAGPRSGVLIGASNRAQCIDEAYCNGLVAHCRNLHSHDRGSFLVTVSRRTPAAITALLRREFIDLPGLFWAGPEDGDNPYAGILAWSDRLIVTPDSVNMVSEACASGHPTWIHAPRPIRGKLARFHAELIGAGHLRVLGDTDVRPPLAPLRETAAVAELIRIRWPELFV